MIKTLLAATIFFLTAFVVQAQAPKTNVVTVPAGATIQFCQAPANGVPCTNLATTYTSSTLTTPCPPSTQIVLDGTTTCVATPDAQNNWGVWVPPGQYAYTVTLQGGVNLGPYFVTASAAPNGSPGSFTTLTATGATSIVCKQLNASYLCADQFTGVDASAKIAAAITALPAAGGTVDARALTDAGGTGSTVIDPGAKSVTLLFGPYVYQIQQLILETNLHVIGSGMGQAVGGAQPTILQACATCAAINTIVLGTNGGTGGPVQHVYMEGLRVYGAVSDTAIGMNLKTVNGPSTGLWYSTFRNICVGLCDNVRGGFSGGAIVLDATGTNTINQFIDFYNVQAFKTNGGSPAFSILGTNGQMNFNQCEFDGPTRNDGTTVLQIANSSGNQGPYSLTFIGPTVQHGSTGINIAGALGPLVFIGTHFETVGQAISVNSGVGGDVSGGISFIGSTCQNFCGNNSGAGWFAKTTTPAVVSVVFIKNEIISTVDATYLGFTAVGNFYSVGDESDTVTTTTPIPQSTLFANLGTPTNGLSIYCSDCTIANPCASGGTGAFAKRLNGVWVCN